MQNNFTVHLDCWPVGQGLFISGRLESEKPKKTFHWVYDCGSSCATRSVPLRNCVDNYNKQIEKKTPIDLLIISHFDRDHINGIVRLCAGRKVKHILIPYITPWIRRCWALSELKKTEKPIDEAMLNSSIVNDPVKWLKDNIKPDKIFVALSENDKESEEGVPESLDEESEFGLRYEPLPIALPADHGYKDTRGVSALKSGTIAYLANFWEFIPYNDNIITRKWLEDCLKLILKAAARRFRITPNARNLKALTWLYHKTRIKGTKHDKNAFLYSYFKSRGGTLPKGHSGQVMTFENIISLFLYCGPQSTQLDHLHTEERYYRNGTTKPNCFQKRDKNAQLYMGDGYLTLPEQWNRLCNFYGQRRINRISFLQVMHHGAFNNWQTGLAARIKPRISMFSSDPYAKDHHPHIPVWHDFMPYNPIQVGGPYGCHLKVQWDFTAP